MILNKKAGCVHSCEKFFGGPVFLIDEKTIFRRARAPGTGTSTTAGHRMPLCQNVVVYSTGKSVQSVSTTSSWHDPRIHVLPARKRTNNGMLWHKILLKSIDFSKTTLQPWLMMMKILPPLWWITDLECAKVGSSQAERLF